MLLLLAAVLPAGQPPSLNALWPWSASWVATPWPFLAARHVPPVSWPFNAVTPPNGNGMGSEQEAHVTRRRGDARRLADTALSPVSLSLEQLVVSRKRIGKRGMRRARGGAQMERADAGKQKRVSDVAEADAKGMRCDFYDHATQEPHAGTYLIQIGTTCPGKGDCRTLRVTLGETDISSKSSGKGKTGADDVLEAASGVSTAVGILNAALEFDPTGVGTVVGATVSTARAVAAVQKGAELQAAKGLAKAGSKIAFVTLMSAILTPVGGAVATAGVGLAELGVAAKTKYTKSKEENRAALMEELKGQINRGFMVAQTTEAYLKLQTVHALATKMASDADVKADKEKHKTWKTSAEKIGALLNIVDGRVKGLANPALPFISFAVCQETDAFDLEEFYKELAALL